MIVTEPDHATPEWLSEVLGCSVRAVTGQTRIGTGQMSRNFRLDLDSDGPASIVLKVPAELGDTRELGKASYEKEVAFYSQLAADVQCLIPRCHHHVISDDGYDFTLVLEDMAPAEQGDQIGGCSVAQAKLALANLAGAQGPRWNDPTLTDLPIFAPQDTSMLRAFYPMAHDQFMSRYGDRLMDHTAAALDAFRDKSVDWAENTPGPFGLVHGDYRLDNLLFTENSVAAVDWQTIALGPPARDLAYFLGNSLTIEDRRTHEADLMQSYLDALAGHGVTDYSMDELSIDYARAAWHGPLITVLGAFAASQTDRGDEMFIVMADRSTAQIADHNSVQYL